MFQLFLFDFLLRVSVHAFRFDLEAYKTVQLFSGNHMIVYKLYLKILKPFIFLKRIYKALISQILLTTLLFSFVGKKKLIKVKK